MAMKRNTTPTIQTTPDNIRHMIRALIKLLMGEQDRVHEQSIPLKRHELALDMRDVEGHVLDAIYLCHNEYIPPTPEAIINILQVNRRLSNPREVVEAIVRENREEEFGIKFYSNIIHEWLNERRMAAVGLEIATIADDPYLDYGDKWEAGFEMFLKTSPQETFVHEDIEEPSFSRLVYERNQEAIAARKAGVGVGPELPFAAQKALFSHFDWGEASLVIGKRGDGKSTLGMELGENIAWRQKLKCDVNIFALETPLEVLSVRQFCRHNMLPYEEVASGEKVDLSTGKWKAIWDNWMSNPKVRGNDYGYMKFHYSPMASVSDITAKMWSAAEASRSLGRRVVFIIDHLHSIDWEKTHGKMEEFNALRAIFRILAGTANQISTKVDNHLFILAQEGEKRGEMFGGKFAAMRAQYVMSMKRDRFGEPDGDGNYPPAPDDLPVTVTASAVKPEDLKSGLFEKKDDKEFYKLDALGNRRYWYKKGDLYKHTGRITLTKSNDGRPGSIELLCEMTMNRITQDPNQVTELRKQKRLPPEGKE
jgi:hypothetical protein